MPPVNVTSRYQKGRVRKDNKTMKKTIKVNDITFTQATKTIADNILYHYRNRARFIYYTDIFDAYEHPSREKIKSFNKCVEIKNKLNGFYNFISGYSIQQFSYIFGFSFDKRYTAVVKITKDNKYIVLLDGDNKFERVIL